MDGLTLLDEARAAGLSVQAVDGRLLIRGPRRAESVVRRLIACKALVMQALTADDLPSVGPDDLPPDWREWFGERLAIMAEQCDGPAPDHLRVIALADTLDAMRRAGEYPVPHRQF
jgi:hypothetical protein